MADLILKNGLKAYKEKRYEDALKYFNKLEDDVKKNYYLGLTYVRLNDYDSAIFHLKNYLKSETDYQIMIQVLTVLGYIYVQKKEYEKAKIYFEKALNLDFNNSKVYAALGYVYYKLNNFNEAIKVLKKAIEIDEKNATAHNSLGYIYADKNLQLEEAIRECEIALKISPDYPAYLDSLGWAYYKKGDIKKAKELIAKALESLGDNEEIKSHFREIVIKEISKRKEKID